MTKSGVFRLVSLFLGTFLLMTTADPLFAAGLIFTIVGITGISN